MKNSNELWTHQERAITAAMRAIAAGRPSGLWVLPTGAGKTAAFLTLAKRLAVPTCVLVHRDTLIRQTVETAAEWWPEASLGVVQAARDEWQVADLVVASVQTLRADRLARIPRDRFGLLISDEAHRSVAKGWSRAVEHFEVGFHLGVTATPDRLDGVGLGKHFGKDPLSVYTLREAMSDAILVPIRQYGVETGVSVDEVRESSRNRWDVDDLSRTVNVQARNQLVVESYQKHGTGRRAVAFAVDVAHVRALAAAFTDAGIPAVAITGEDVDRRKQDLEDFRAGKYRVAVNCEVLTEGYNDPDVSCVLFARPTKSKLLYMQAIGRALRVCPSAGKTDCLVLDFVDASTKHKLVSACNLLGLRKGDAGGQDIMEQVREQEREDEELSVQIHQRRLLSPVAWRLKEVSPWPDMPSLAGYEQTRRWQAQPATEKQVSALGKMGLSLTRDMTRGEASWLFDRAREYDYVFPLPATSRQRYVLEQAGLWRDGLGKREAGRLIGELRQTVGDARGG